MVLAAYKHVFARKHVFYAAFCVYLHHEPYFIKGNESVSLLKAMKMEINVNRKKQCLFSLGKRLVMMLLLLQGIWMSAAHAVGVGGSSFQQ